MLRLGLYALVGVATGGLACQGGSDIGPTSGASSPADDGGGSGTAAADSTGADDTLGSHSGSSATGGASLEIDCAGPPAGAVGAQYDHTPTTNGAVTGLTWLVTGLPDGMVFDPLTGRVSGAPTMAGTYDAVFEASGGSPAQTAMQTCTLQVGDALSLDFDALGKPCIGPGDAVADFLVGGDGAAPTCSTPGGGGNGKLPDGISVDSDSCGITGTTSDKYGTWVWITAVEQSGYRLHVPYCYTQDQQAPGAYTIVGAHSGGTDNALEPAVRTFAPGQPLSFGGGGDPRFEVFGPCGPGCWFGFAFFYGPSPFGGCGAGPCYGLSPSQLLTDAGGAPVGFSHEMFALGPPVTPEFEQRAFVLSWDLSYCISPTEAECADVVRDGNGELRFGVIMLPE